MRIGRGNRSTRRKPAPALLCPPQIPYDVTWARIWAAWAMVRPRQRGYGSNCHARDFVLKLRVYGDSAENEKMLTLLNDVNIYGRNNWISSHKTCLHFLMCLVIIRILWSESF
jgi:hypothetical protein